MKKQFHSMVILLIIVAVFSILISPKLFQKSDTYSNTKFPVPYSANGGVAPIHISNNSELAMWSSSGDGNSWETAYIIENLNIFTDNVSDTLLIENTSKFCVIQNCTFTNFYFGQDYSIRIKNASNIRVTNNSAYHSGYGFRVMDSENIRIQENTLFNHSTCLSLSNLHNIEISGNQLIDYTWTGLNFSDGSGDIQIYNNFYQAVKFFYLIFPIFMFRVTNFTIKNDISTDFLRSFFMECSNFIFENTTYGEFYISRSHDFAVLHCRIIGMVDLNECWNFYFAENTIEGRETYRNYAIGLSSCYDFNITRNRIDNYQEFAFYIFDIYIGENNTEIAERIENNIIRWKGRALVGFSKNVDRRRSPKLGWNWIIPPISYVVMCVIIFAVTLLLVKTKFKFSSITRKLERTKNPSFTLISDSQLFFYHRIVKIGLIFGSFLIPLTLIHVYSNTGWFSWLYDPRYDFSLSNSLKWNYYTLEEFTATQTAISLIWVVCFVLYIIIILIYSRTPKMLRKKKPKLYGYQIRNIVLVTIGVVIILVIQTLLILYGLWVYLGYFYSVLLLGGFLWAGFSHSFDRRNQYMWKFLIGFILLIISHIIIHAISTTDLWESDKDPIILSLQFLRGAVLLGALTKWGSN